MGAAVGGMCPVYSPGGLVIMGALSFSGAIVITTVAVPVRGGVASSIART